MRRAFLLWLLLFAAYAATLGLDAFGESDYGGDEPHYLLAAESLVEDGDLDVKRRVRRARLRRLLPVRARPARRGDRGPAARAARRRLPAADRAGVRDRRRAGRGAVPGAIAALACALAYLLALRVVPDPWALRRGAGRRPLALRSSPTARAVYPELTAGGGARRRRAAGAARLEERVRGATRSAASRCSAPCRGSARSSCRRGS